MSNIAFGMDDTPLILANKVMSEKLSKISGRDYLSAVKAFKALKTVYTSYSPARARDVQHIFLQGASQLADVYSKNASDIYDFYAAALNASDPNQIAQAAQGLAAQRSELIHNMLPQIKYVENVKAQNERLADLVKRLNNKAAEISTEQRSLQKKVINYQTSGAAQSQGGGLTKLLIPLALGVGGFMLLKG